MENENQTQKQNQNQNLRRIIFLSAVAILLVVLIGFVSCQKQNGGPTGSSTSSTTSAPVSSAPALESSTVADSTEAPPESSSEAPESTPDTTADTEPPVVDLGPKYISLASATAEIYTGNLIRVNEQSPYCYKVASLYSPAELDKLSASELAETGWASLYAGKNGNYLLRSRLIFLRSEVYSAFTLMMNSFVAKTGMRDVQVRYGFQLVNSTADAASLSDERVTGLVVELNVYTEEGTFSIDHTSKKNVYYEWFAANCHKFGFVMTGESGYFRYVGLPHAVYMQKNGYDLDDYLAVLSNYSFEEPLAVTDGDGVVWNVYSVKASSSSLTDVKIRENSVYVISGNNRDSFIVASRDK